MYFAERPLKTMFSIFLLVVLNPFTLVLGDCPDGSTTWGALCFQGYIEKETWNKAEQLCSQYWNRGHLVSVTDAYLNSVLPYVFDTAAVDYWIGAKFSGGKWTWSDSSDFTYENWARGQPNNTMGYCAVQRYSDSEWLSHPCSQKKQYICEFPSPNVTRTTTPPNCLPNLAHCSTNDDACCGVCCSEDSTCAENIAACIRKI